MTRYLFAILIVGLCSLFFSMQSNAQPTAPPVAPPGVAVANVAHHPPGPPPQHGPQHGPQIAPVSPVPRQTRIYSLKTIRPDDAETQLRALLSPELASQTVMLADIPRKELFVQGPPTALLTIDVLLPAIDSTGEKVVVGLLPPNPGPAVSPSSRQGHPQSETVQQDGAQPGVISATPSPDPIRRPGHPYPASAQPLPVNPMHGVLPKPAASPAIASHPTAPPAIVQAPVAHPAVVPNATISTIPPQSPVVQVASAHALAPHAPVDRFPVGPSPVARPTVAPLEIPAVFEPTSPAVYRIRSERSEVLERQLREAFGSRMDVCIAVKKESGTGAHRFCILAPDSIQATIHRTLEHGGDLLPQVDMREKEGTLVRIPHASRRGDTPGTTSSGAMPSSATAPNTARATGPTSSVSPLTILQSHVGPQSYPPTRLTPTHIEHVLRKTFGERLRVHPSDGKTFELSHPRDPSRIVNITFGTAHAPGGSSGDSSPARENAAIGISGDKEMVAHMLSLVKEIDRPDPPRGRERRFIAVQHADPEAIRRIFEAELARSQSGAQASDASSQSVRSASPDAAKDRPIRQVAFRMQEGGGDLGGAFTDATAGPGAGGVGAGSHGSTSGMEVVPDFRYQVIPDLDVIVIDATGAEVARFEDMIRRIEELSRTAEPQIEIYYLKHVNGISLRWAIQQVLAPVFRTKQGSVEIMPLVNPNAMLLIGWGKAFETMKDLFETLDQPIATDQHSVEVIRLKHAAAAQVIPTLRQAFPTVALTGAGFAPRINILLADQRTNAILIQASPNDLKEAKRIIAELDRSEGGPSVEVRTFKLKNTLANDLAQVLLDAITPGIQGTPDRKLPTLEMLVSDEKGKRMIRSGIMSDVRISRDVRNNAIIVTAPSQCMELIEHLIEILDVANATAVIKVFRILYGDATSMVSTLQTLLPTQLAGQVGPMLPGAREEDTLVPVRFAIDKRTNSIIAAGAVGDLDIVEGLLLSLDREEEQARKVSVYQLKSTEAAPVAEAVNEYLKAKRIIQQAVPGAVSAYEQLESEVVVIPENVQNALIVSATPRYYDEIIKVIEELDRQPAQVVIQVLIAEVTLGNTKELGAEFGIQDSLLFDRSTFSQIQNATTRTTTTNADGTQTIVETVPANAAGNPGFLWGDPSSSLGNAISAASVAGANTIGSQLLTNFATGRTSADAGFGGIVFSASSDAVSIMIRALQETRRLDILSRPQIMALDNQSAFIHVGQDVPRANGTDTTSWGTSAKTEDKKVGLLLMIKPRISADDRVVMDVTAVKSSIDSTDDGITVGYSGDGQAIVSQKINVMQTMTMVSAANNETVMLSGMISKEKQHVNRKVPLLGDIPLLGKLFQYNYDRMRRSELLVILTPRIVRDECDADRIKQMEAARMSWCLCDVNSLHGDTCLYDAGAEIPVTGNTTILYPGAVAEGDILPIESQEDILSLEQRPVLSGPNNVQGAEHLSPQSFPQLAPLPQDLQRNPQPGQEATQQKKTFPTPTLGK